MTLYGAGDDFVNYPKLLTILERRAGRLVMNGFPTGVEVCTAMTHGGPYPASTDSRSTSVGTAAINRFLRPVSYQNFPEELLPPALCNHNRDGLWRLVDRRFGRGDI